MFLPATAASLSSSAPSLDAPAKATRYWTLIDLDADLPALLDHIAARWAVKVFYGDTKDLLGLDQYQFMTATAIARFWILALAACALIEEEQAQFTQEQQRHVTISEVRRALQRLHYRHQASPSR